MSTMIGQTVLDQLIDDLGLENISTGLQAALAVRFGEMYEANFFNNNQLAAVLWANPGSKASLEAAGQTDLLSVGTAVGEAIDNADIPDPLDPSFTLVDIDSGTIAGTPVVFDANNAAYNFTDDAAIETNVIISNFSADDIITFINAEVADYAFTNEGTDVTLSYNYNDEGIMNIIQLTGVVSSESLVYDHASFVASIGFDPFVA